MNLLAWFFLSEQPRRGDSDETFCDRIPFKECGAILLEMGELGAGGSQMGRCEQRDCHPEVTRHDALGFLN